MRKAIFFISGILMVLIMNDLKAQDPQFSQFYAAPLYINPGFTGASGYTRFGINYRNQWPNLEASFNTFSFYADHYLPNANSGIGMIITSDKEGIAGLNSTNIGLSYAYQLKITDNLIFSPGVQFNYFMRSANWADLVFADQINPITGEIFGPTGDPVIINTTGDQVNFLDISVGGVFYTRTLFLGVALQHITEPNQSFIDDGESILPQRLTVHGGLKIKIGEGPLRKDLTYSRAERSITPVFQYKKQGQFSQVDLGAYIHLEPVNFGLQYRGIPFSSFEATDGTTFPNNEALVFILGVTTNSFNIGYSYDYTLSELSPSSGGAHEFSMTYFLNFNKPQRVPRNRWRIPCPKN